MNLSEWCDKWLEIYKEGNVKENTYNNYKYAVKLIKKTFSDQEISEITEIDLQILLKKLYKENYAKSTIRLVKITLNQLFRKAIKYSLVTDNPAEELLIPINAKEKKVDGLSLEDEIEVINACKKTLHGGFLLFLLYTGLRKQEMFDLKWEHFNKDKGFLAIVNSKTKKGIRIIPLTETSISIINEQPRYNEYIFNSIRKSPLTKTVMRRLCERVTEISGVKVTPHICRHTFATRLYNNNADLKSLSEIMGHTSVNFTIQRYVTADINMMKKTIQLIEKISVK